LYNKKEVKITLDLESENSNRYGYVGVNSDNLPRSAQDVSVQ